MADDLVGEEDVFFLGAGADVVDDERGGAGFFVGHDADVEQAGIEAPGNDVTGLVGGGGGVGGRQREVLAFEVAHEVGHASVIDVFVGAFESPCFGIDREVIGHVLVDLLLQVGAGGADGAHDDIGADAGAQRDVAAGVGEFHVTRIVTGGDADLGTRALHDARGGVGGGGGGGRVRGVGGEGEAEREDEEAGEEGAKWEAAGHERRSGMRGEGGTF